MSVRVKICGLRTRRDVDAAVSAGADAVGFVFAESVRRVSPEAAVALADGVPAGVLRVGVFKSPEPHELRAVLSKVRLDFVQMDVDAARSERVAGVAIEFGADVLPVFRDGPGLLAQIEEFAGENRSILVEGPVSGVGVRPDWARIAGASAIGRLRIVLAGGLTAENVGEAIRAVKPWGVDVSSGVESARGVKDPEKIAAFVLAARRPGSVAREERRRG